MCLCDAGWIITQPLHFFHNFRKLLAALALYHQGHGLAVVTCAPEMNKVNNCELLDLIGHPCILNFV